MTTTIHNTSGAIADEHVELINAFIELRDQGIASGLLKPAYVVQIDKAIKSMQLNAVKIAFAQTLEKLRS